MGEPRVRKRTRKPWGEVMWVVESEGAGWRRRQRKPTEPSTRRGLLLLAS